MTLVFAGCYGEQEPATDIGFDHATFNGKGTTNDGPAQVYFGARPPGTPSASSPPAPKTSRPASQGPISEPNYPFRIGLYADASYTFTACARETGAHPMASAPKRGRSGR